MSEIKKQSDRETLDWIHGKLDKFCDENGIIIIKNSSFDDKMAAIGTVLDEYHGEVDSLQCELSDAEEEIEHLKSELEECA